MKFCQNCENMYYIRINENNTNELEYYCRYCNHVDSMVQNEGICIIKDQNIQQDTKDQLINEYTKLG